MAGALTGIGDVEHHQPAMTASRLQRFCRTFNTLLYADASPQLVSAAAEALASLNQLSVVGSSWTTDAPFRETAEAIETARTKGILAVEMEAAALYTFASVKGVQVLCLAHVTNTMGRTGADFEKGDADGTSDALAALERVVAALQVY
jgi:purine-nucleoside phosphorylase